MIFVLNFNLIILMKFKHSRIFRLSCRKYAPRYAQARISARYTTGSPPVDTSYRRGSEFEKRTTNTHMGNHMVLRGRWHRKIRTDFGFFATSVCWRSFPFSRQSHANGCRCAPQVFPPMNSIEDALREAKRFRRRGTDTARLQHPVTRSDRSIMRYRADWAQTY